MAGELNGMKVAVLATDGVEQVELDRPWQALEEAGAEPELVSLESGSITAYDHIDKGGTRKVDAVVSSADPDVYGALVLPGGVINGDFVRADPDAVAFVTSLDRKSTRLNSSHANISYAVFCLKKKKKRIYKAHTSV